MAAFISPKAGSAGCFSQLRVALITKNSSRAEHYAPIYFPALGPRPDTSPPSQATVTDSCLPAWLKAVRWDSNQGTLLESFGKGSSLGKRTMKAWNCQRPWQKKDPPGGWSRHREAEEQGGDTSLTRPTKLLDPAVPEVMPSLGFSSIWSESLLCLCQFELKAVWLATEIALLEYENPPM